MRSTSSIRNGTKAYIPLISALTLLAASANAVGDTQFTRAFAWAYHDNKPLNVENGLNEEYSYSSSHTRLTHWPYRRHNSTEIRQTRTGTGKYRIRVVNGALDGGTTQISAYGGSHHCKVVRWFPNRGDQLINVACFKPNGQPTNGKFTVLFYNNGEKGDYVTDAYLWADQPSNDSYIANTRYSYNSGNALNRIKRVSSGSYIVSIPKMQGVELPGREINKGGTVMVTSYGSNSTSCQVVNWSPLGQTMNVRVACHDSTGQPADSKFVLSFNKNIGSLGGTYSEDILRGAYAYISSTNSTPNYYQHSSGGQITSRKTGNGRFKLEIPQLRSIGSSAQLTAYGPDARHCSVDSWLDSQVYSFGTTVYVSCRTSTGALVDAPFVMQYITSQPILH